MSHARSWTRALLSAPLVLVLFSYPAFSAGYYSQSFDSNPPGWVAVGDSWNATSGYYANATTAPFRAITYYGDRRWDTGFTYSLRMYSDLRGTGNHKVGVVFNYVNDQNYQEVTISMVGDVADNVELNEVTNGLRTLRAKARSAIPTVDTWFDVAVTRADDFVRVRIGNVDVLHYHHLPAPVGYVGVLSEYNRGRFDDVKVTPVVFYTGFENGVEVTPPTCVGQTYQLDLTGTEDFSGTVFPPTFWGEPIVASMNTSLTCTRTFSDYLEVNTDFGMLFNRVRDVTPQPDNQNSFGRLGLSYTPGAVAAVPYRFYVRRYLRYSSELASPGPGKWFVQHEFKNATCSEAQPPRRLILYWHTDSSNRAYYRLKMDHSNNMNCGFDWNAPASDFPEQRCFAAPHGPCPAFITNQWFYDEWFVQYSGGGASTDRVAYAINGHVIFDYPAQVTCPAGQQCRVRSSKPKGIKLTPGYLNIPMVSVQVDDLEIYHDAPCRTFPCGPPLIH